MLRRPYLLGLLAVVGACGEPEYEIVVRFDPAALAESVERLEVALVDDCEEQVLGQPAASERVVAWSRGGRAGALGVTEAGRHGLYARGLSASCEPVASGCEPVDLEDGGSGRLVVTVRAATGPGCPTGTSCRAGACVSDGGCAMPDVIVDAALGAGTSCAVGSSGMLWCWGNNEHGSVGVGTSGLGTEVLLPVRVGVETSWAAVAAGQDHICATGTDGTLWCWGYNSNGQLGQGDGSARHVPTRLGTGTAWAAVSLGKDHSCALDTGGALYCWGENRAGQLGVGDLTERSVPTEVAGGPWAQLGAGWEHTCAVDTAGGLWCWGDNAVGSLGDGSTTSRSTPVQVGVDTDWAEVAGGTGVTCARKTDGTLWCWGHNSLGQLGQGTFDAEGTPQTTPLQVGSEADWTAVTSGDDHVCGLRAGGALFCWGGNDEGEAGIGSSSTRVTSPTRVGTLDGWLAPEAGDDYGCAIQSDGALWCWGDNELGQLGVGEGGTRSAPVQVCFPAE